jgi:hypothetical protein
MSKEVAIKILVWRLNAARRFQSSLIAPESSPSHELWFVAAGQMRTTNFVELLSRTKLNAGYW